jgi:hypothetical protein
MKLDVNDLETAPQLILQDVVGPSGPDSSRLSICAVIYTIIEQGGYPSLLIRMRMRR